MTSGSFLSTASVVVMLACIALLAILRVHFKTWSVQCDVSVKQTVF